MRDLAAATGLAADELAALPPSASEWLTDAVMARDEWVTWPIRRHEGRGQRG